MTEGRAARSRSIAAACSVVVTALLAAPFASCSNSAPAASDAGSPFDAGASPDALGVADSYDAPDEVGSSDSSETSEEETSSDAQGNPETAPSDGAPTESGLEAGTCTSLPEVAPPDCFASLVVSGTIVTATCGSGTPPLPQGGDIPYGDYDLQSLAVYGDCGTLPVVQARIVICGNRWDVLQGFPVPDGSTPIAPFWGSYLVSIQGTSVVQTPTCTIDLDTDVVTVSYSVAGSQLTIMGTTGDQTQVLTYVKD
ncbi:MAG: hypothetical protein ABTD50_16810 [Polyangiaceae bacterium]|jgi:hypothetical protein